MQRLQGNVNSGVNQWGNTFFVNVPQFARGGYVTGRTLAEIGEGGPEYVVPASKAMAFANNIVAGRRGEQALIPIGNAAKQAAGYIFDPFGVERTRRDIAARKGNIQEFEKLRIDRENRRLAQADPWMKPISASSGTGRGSVAFGPRMSNPLAGMATTKVESLGRVEVKQNLRIDRVERRSDGDYVTLNAAEQIAANASSDAVNQIIKLLQQPTFRRQVGIA